MAKLELKDTGFIPGRTYTFNPPVLTNCILVNDAKGWTQKYFSKGWCLKFENGEGVFKGKPFDGEAEYFFRVIYGKGGSVAVIEG